MCSLSSSEVLKPLAFPKVSFVKEAALGPHLKMGAGCQGSQSRDERFGTFSPTPSGEGRGGERGWKSSMIASGQ